MFRSAAGKVMWVWRATVFLVGLSVILALLFGVATTAMGANGSPFLLGKKNVETAISTLVNKGPGPALNLVVGANQPPMKVNSSAKVANLNADGLDGKDSTQFVQGTGSVERGQVAVPAGVNNQTILTLSNPDIRLSYYCPSDVLQNGALMLTNTGSENLNVLSDRATDSSQPVQYRVVPPESEDIGGFNQPQRTTAAAGDHLTIGVQGQSQATINVFTVHRPNSNDCHVQAQAVVSR